VPGAPAVDAENEFLEAGSEVPAAQPVISAKAQSFSFRQDEVDPGHQDVRDHLADDMGIRVIRQTGIPGPAIGLDGGARTRLAARTA
jgi:hypothetical protein